MEMSAFDAAQMLQRRKQSLEEKAISEDGQMTALDNSTASLPVSTAAAAQDGLLEISEAYDEAVHGPLQSSRPALNISEAGGDKSSELTLMLLD